MDEKKSECDFLWSFWKHLCKIFRRHLFHRLVNKIMFIFLPNAQQDILEMCQFFKVQNSTDKSQQKKKKFARNKQQTKLSNRFSYWYLQILFFSLGDYVKFATTNQKNFQDTKLITRIGCIQRLELKQFGFFYWRRSNDTYSLLNQDWVQPLEIGFWLDNCKNALYRAT